MLVVESVEENGQGAKAGIQAGDRLLTYDSHPLPSSAALQALTLAVPSSDIVVATSNVSHISCFVAADLWTNITP